jgi:hemerythrin-like domain-containing protein
MSGSTNILALMVRDHCKIEQLLNELELNAEKEYSMRIKLFNKFEWHLEKHIFMEEKAIFTSYNPDDVVQGYKMLPTLTKQHNEILNRLNIMRKDVRSRRAIKDIYSFKEFILKHKNFEEKDVYPKLDQELDESQKKIIIARINEII